MNLIALKVSFVFYFCLDNIIKPIIPMLFMTLKKQNKSFLWNFKRFSYDTLALTFTLGNETLPWRVYEYPG